MTPQKTLALLLVAVLSLVPTIVLAQSSETPMPPLYVEYAAQATQLSEPVLEVEGTHYAAVAEVAVENTSPLAANVLALDPNQSLAVSGVILVLALLALWLFRGQIAKFAK